MRASLTIIIGLRVVVVGGEDRCRRRGGEGWGGNGTEVIMMMIRLLVKLIVAHL